MGMAQAAAALLQQYRTPMQEEAALLLLFSGSSHQSLETVGPSCLKPIRCPMGLPSPTSAAHFYFPQQLAGLGVAVSAASHRP